jgi:4-amino-4-deoxy-L-arabinose transferase-like glycosyltransferase
MATQVLEPELESGAGGNPPAPVVSHKLFPSMCLVLLAFSLRLVFLFGLQTYRPDRVDDFCIAGETTNIASSIASGYGFSRPFNGDNTGPTAWIAPAYPYFVASVFRLFGVMTRASVTVIFAAQSLFSALTVIPILGIARLTVGRTAGLWAASLWALFPWFSKWSVTWVWDMTLSALLISLLFWYALRLVENSSWRSWIGFGALWGGALLVNPALASFLPVSLCWCCYELGRRKQVWLKPAACSLLMCIAVISPWLLRNRVVFGRWVFLRSNFGFEFALGNYHASFGRGWGGHHPSGNQKEFRQYWQMGEIAYVEAKERQAIDFVKNYRGEFAALTARRLVYFWDGSAMGYRATIPRYWAPSSFAALSFLLLPALLVTHRRTPHAWPMFFELFLLYPAPYYLTFSQVRYRHAIEPVMLLVIAAAGVETARLLAAFLRPMPNRTRAAEELVTPPTLQRNRKSSLVNGHSRYAQSAVPSS